MSLPIIEDIDQRKKGEKHARKVRNYRAGEGTFGGAVSSSVLLESTMQTP